MHSIQLAPFPRPIGIFPHFTYRRSQTLVMREHIGGEDLAIRTVDGRLVLQVKGERLSLSQRKHVLDASDRQLFDLRKEHLKVHTTFYAEGISGARLLEVKSQFSLGGSKQICSFRDHATGQTTRLLLRGNHLAKSATIVEESSGHTVAEIHRKFLNARQMLAGAQTYHVTVASNVDIALIAAICICLDEKQKERSGGGDA